MLILSVTNSKYFWYNLKKSNISPINIQVEKMRVKNLNETSEKTCSCGSWLKHWEKISGKKADKCYIIGCDNESDLVGGHVQKVYLDKNHYIIPLCKSCNGMRDKEFDVEDALISANKKDTCEKI